MSQIKVNLVSGEECLIDKYLIESYDSDTTYPNSRILLTNGEKPVIVKDSIEEIKLKINIKY